LYTVYLYSWLSAAYVTMTVLIGEQTLGSVPMTETIVVLSSEHSLQSADWFTLLEVSSVSS